MKIYKYKLQQIERQIVCMPANAIIRHINVQHDNIRIWAEVDERNENECRTFRIVGTGHDLPEGELQYIGTCHYEYYVWHIYEELTK